MSWAAVNRELRELLPRFALPAAVAVAQKVSDRLFDLGRQGGQIPRLQADSRPRRPRRRPCASKGAALFSQGI